MLAVFVFVAQTSCLTPVQCYWQKQAMEEAREEKAQKEYRESQLLLQKAQLQEARRQNDLLEDSVNLQNEEMQMKQKEAKKKVQMPTPSASERPSTPQKSPSVSE